MRAVRIEHGRCSQGLRLAPALVHRLGFRVPNMVVSPFARRHYVSHVPMDHTAIIRFVEDRFIGNGQYLTAKDAAQPNLLDFFDFTGVPWATPPTQTATPPPAPIKPQGPACPGRFIDAKARVRDNHRGPGCSDI